MLIYNEWFFPFLHFMLSQRENMMENMVLAKEEKE